MKIKESKQLDKFYHSLYDKNLPHEIAEIMSEIVDASSYNNSDRGKMESLCFELGFEFAQKVKKGQRVYSIYDADITYYFIANNVNHVIMRLLKSKMKLFK